MQSPWKRARIQMEEDDYDDGDGSYGEEDDEKAGFLSLLNKGMRHSFHLNAWISNAIKRKLRVLSLSMDKVKDYTLALAPFQCYDDGYDSSYEEYAIYWAGNGNAFTDYEIVVDAPKLEGDVSTIGLKPLTGTYNAKFLSLSGRSMKLGCNEYCGQLLPKLLEKSPNLEVLILGKDNAKLNTARDLVKIHMGATAVRS
ncbi:hypothetical protein Goshw_002845 [Gossypium schwendimanii]|uniref:Uncharacterized protein n=1 Tax=Gossypium schwendimanii TaxID=34291 RepID=A0A7J9LK04_GOSSC|nr:hypothetical protein [Gossypium schwendimanii]